MTMQNLHTRLAAALLMGCLFLAACENKIEEVHGINKKTIGIEEGKNVRIQYSLGARRKAILSGPIMYRVQDTVPYIEFTQTLHVDFYNLQDSIESKLDAHYAKYKDAQSKVFLKDSVRVINVMGDTLYCDELYWDRSKTNVEFYTDKPVRIRTRTHIIDGIGMEASQDFKNWHIIESKGFIKVPATQFPN